MAAEDLASHIFHTTSNHQSDISALLFGLLSSWAQALF